MNSRRDSNDQLPDLSGLVFRTAQADHEMDAVLECRWKGYRRYGFAGPAACRDDYDARAIQYFCEDAESKRILGCLRLLPFRDRPFELEEYFDISGWANDGTIPAELTRFSIPPCKRLSAIKLGLWKLAWLDATARGHTHFLICTAEYTKKMYEALGFVPYPGNSCGFLHTTLRSTPHIVMTFDLVSAWDLYRHAQPSLYRFFGEMTHSNILPTAKSP